MLMPFLRSEANAENYSAMMQGGLSLRTKWSYNVIRRECDILGQIEL